MRAAASALLFSNKQTVNMFIIVLRRLKRGKSTPMKCWTCKYYTPMTNKFGVCERIKHTVNYRDYREADVRTESINAEENCWHISQIRVLGYMVCDLYKSKMR